MPTVVTHTLKKDGTGDYTTINAWASAVGRNLVAADEIARLEIYKAGWDRTTPLLETWVECGGNRFTTDATRRVELVVVDGDQHTFLKDTGFVYSSASSYGFLVRGAYVYIEGIEYDTDGETPIMFYQAANLKQKNNMLYGDGLANVPGESSFCMLIGGRPNNQLSNGGVLISTTVVADALAGNNNNSILLQNCTLIDCAVYKPNAATSYSWLYTCTETYCAANMSGEGVSDATSRTDLSATDFVDFSGGDYRIASSSPLAAAGSGGTFIGAALESGGGGGTTPVITIPASINVTPTNAAVPRVNNIATTPVAITVAPQDALVDRVNQIIASAAAVSVTPGDAIVERVNSITAIPAAISISPTDALVERINAITTIPAQIKVTPSNALLSQDPVIVATPASISVVATAAVINRVNSIAANPAAIAVAPQNASVERINSITATTSAISVSAANALVERVNAITGIPVQINVTPTDALFIPSGAIVCTSASISVTPIDALVERVNTITTIPASISVIPVNALIGEQIDLSTALILNTGIHFGTPDPVIGRWHAQQPIATLTFR